MEKQKLYDREKGLISKLFDQLTETGYEPQIATMDKTGLNEVVTLELDGLGIGGDYALCHLFFIPSHEEDSPVNNFRTIMNITDSIEGDQRKLEVMQAVTYLNFLVPFGAFVLDPELNVLSYRRDTAIPATLEEETTLALMGREFLDSAAILAPFISPLVCLTEGEFDLPQFAEAIKIVTEKRK